MLTQESQDRDGRSKLHYAAMENDVNKIQELIAEGADIDFQDGAGFAALHYAAEHGSLDAGRILLEAGGSTEVSNSYGNTPLWTAVFNCDGDGHGEFIRLLREHGANPDHLNKSGKSPREMASVIANYDVAQFFSDWPPS